MSRGGIAKGAAVLTIGLVAVGALFASVAGGKTEERTTCRFHDPGGERDVVQTARFTGGGAGGVDRPLAFDLDSPNVLWLDRHTPTGLHSVRLTTVSAGGTSSASIGTPAFTGTNLVSLVAISLLPPAPAWEVRARREKGRLQGTIRFDRLLRSVAVVDGRSVFTVGSVSPGSVVDLSSLGPAMSLKAFWESSGRGDVSLAERARFGPAGWGTFSQRAGDLLVLGEEVSTSAGAAERCVHVERVRIAGDRPAPLLRAPGWQEKLEIHVVVPSNVRGPFTAFSGNLFFASQRPDRVIARPDGYQELAFRGLRPYLASEHRARADVPPQVFEVTMRVGEVRDGV